MSNAFTADIVLFKDHDYVDSICAQSPSLMIPRCLIHYAIHQQYRMRAISAHTLSILQQEINIRWNDLEHPHKEVLGLPIVGDVGLTVVLPTIIKSVARKTYEELLANNHTFLTISTGVAIPQQYAGTAG